jgi:phage protein D/phage baseplate assembly protein gpV
MTAPLLHQAPLTIALGGAPLARPLAQTLAAVFVRQALAAPSVAELDFANPDPEAASGLAHDQPLRVGGSGGSILFDGDIASIQHDYDGAAGHVVRVRAYDPLQRLRTRRRVRTLATTSAADLATELAGDIGCGSAATRSTPGRDLVIQAGESDLDLLADLAAEAGLYPFIDDGTLKLVGLDGDGEEIPLALGRTLQSVRITLSSERALTRGEARGWSPATSHRFQAEAATASQDALDLRDLGLRAHAAERLILNALVDSEGEARALAQADMDRGAAYEAAVVGTAFGDPAIRPGRPLRIDGVGADLAGLYVVTEAVHRFDAASGYTTEFATTPPAPQPRLRETMFSLGEVSDTADPEGFGRCRVKLPALSDVESGWMPVVVAGAGSGKGLAALPESGDDVLVVFPDGDPARGIVLGGLYGTKRLPRGAGRKHKRPFVLRTGGGQTLELAADSALARLSTSAGSIVEMAPGGMRVAAASDLIIEAPGRTITIRAAGVNFEKG